MRRRRLTAVAAAVAALALGGGASLAQADEETASVAAAQDRPMIALTFDDGPSRLTPEVLDALEHHDVKATFFMQGAHVAQHPTIARDVVREGHVVGNHGYSHPDFSTISTAAADREITRTSTVIARATGVDPVLFRYPYGRESEGGNEVIRREEMWGGVLWHWTETLPGDFECPGADGVADYVEANARDQAIILLHDGNEVLDCDRDQVDYLDEVIPRLKAQGYDFGVVMPAFAPSPTNQYSWVRVVAPEEAATW